MNITRTVQFSALLIFLCLALLLVHSYQTSRRTAVPDFSELPAGPERKDAFFAYLQPLIVEANDDIARDRQALEQLAACERTLSSRQRRWLHQLAETYLLDPEAATECLLVSELLHRVDVIPESLVLAQAAKESGWGTARFTVDGYNYFGQRCWSEGCGMMPAAREPGLTHEVARFESVDASVRSYLHNLNSHADYAALRAYRAESRERGERASGIQLAEHLSQYSERRQAYIDELQAFILFNELEQTMTVRNDQ